jgi:hypothetical protein
VGCFAHSREGVEGTLGDDEMGMQLLLQTATHGYPAHLPGAETPDTPSIGPTARADRRLAPNLPRGTPASRAAGRQQKNNKKGGLSAFSEDSGFREVHWVFGSKNNVPGTQLEKNLPLSPGPSVLGGDRVAV